MENYAILIPSYLNEFFFYRCVRTHIPTVADNLTHRFYDQKKG